MFSESGLERHLGVITYIVLPAGKTVCESKPASASILVLAACMVICCLASSFMARRSFFGSTSLPLYVRAVDLPACALLCKIPTIADFFAAGMLLLSFHFLLM